MRCQACREREASWAWQPFGPDASPDSFSLLGSHYKGFPVIKVCTVCQSAVHTGDFAVNFTYKGHDFVVRDHRVKELHISLWDGGTSTFESARGSGTLLMRDTIGDAELAAIVANPELVSMFIAAPRLVEACADLLKHASRIESWAEGLLYEDLLPGREIRMTLAKMRLALHVAQGEA